LIMQPFSDIAHLRDRGVEFLTDSQYIFGNWNML